MARILNFKFTYNKEFVQVHCTRSHRASGLVIYCGRYDLNRQTSANIIAYLISVSTKTTSMLDLSRCLEVRLSGRRLFQAKLSANLGLGENN